MLSTRVVFGLLMVAGLLTALWVDEWFAPWFPFWFLLSAAAMLGAAWEITGLLSGTSVNPSRNSVIGGVLAIVIANWMPHLIENHSQADGESALLYDPGRPIDILAWPFLTFIAVLMACFVVQSIQFARPGRTMAKISGTVLAIAYVGLLGSFTIQMRWFEGRHQGLMALVYLIATAKGADTGAYTLGRLAGRHKLWPQLSPKKTVEGALGGLAFGVGRLAPGDRDRPPMARHPDLHLALRRHLRTRHRRRRPARRPDGIDDQARLRTQGRLAGRPGLRRPPRRPRFDHVRRPGRLCALALVRALRSGHRDDRRRLRWERSDPAGSRVRGRPREPDSPPCLPRPASSPAGRHGSPAWRLSANWTQSSIPISDAPRRRMGSRLQTRTRPTRRAKSAISPKAVLPRHRTLAKSITKFLGTSGRMRESSWAPSSRAWSGPQISGLRNSMTISSGFSPPIGSQAMWAQVMVIVDMESLLLARNARRT